MIWLRYEEALELQKALTKASRQLYNAHGQQLKDVAEISLQQVSGVFSLLIGVPCFVEGIRPGYLEGGVVHTFPLPEPAIPRRGPDDGQAESDTGAGAGSGGQQDSPQSDERANRRKDKERFVHPL